MKIGNRTERGLLLLSVAIGLAFTATVATGTIVATGWAAGLSASDRIVFLSTLGLVVPIFVFGIGAVGFREVWRGRQGSSREVLSALSLSRWAGVVGVAAYGAWTLTGLLLGLLSVEGPLLRSIVIAYVALAPLGALAIGLSLLWAARGLAAPGAVRVSLVAFGLGAVATSLFLFALLDFAAMAEPVALPLFWAERLAATASMALWLLVFVSMTRRSRTGTTTPPVPSVPT